MKILAIGGSGGMGRFAVDAVQHSDSVEQIVVADINEVSARGFAAQLTSKVSAIGLDVNDGAALRKAMADTDLVMNTCGPFFLHAVHVLQAAIETGCHYLDICDDWEPTLEMLAFDQKAKEAGVSATVGLGASPGISNMLALIAMRELDSCSTVYTGWDFGGATPESESSQAGVNAAMLHGIEQMTGKVKIFRNSSYELTKPLAPITVRFPGLKPFRGHIFGHPEAITFPHHFNDLKESVNACHGSKQSNIYILKILRWLVDKKLISFKQGASFLEWLERKIGTPSIEKQIEGLPSIYGLARGLKDNKNASVAVTLSEEELSNSWGMGAITGFPLAFGLKLLLENKINKKGVFAPEGGAINPDDFFSLLTDHPLSVSRSWET